MIKFKVWHSYDGWSWKLVYPTDVVEDKIRFRSKDIYTSGVHYRNQGRARRDAQRNCRSANAFLQGLQAEDNAVPEECEV